MGTWVEEEYVKTVCWDKVERMQLEKLGWKKRGGGKQNEIIDCYINNRW